MAFQDLKHKGVISNFTGNGIHCLGAFEYFQVTQGNQTIDVATRVGIYSSNDSGSNLTEIVLSPTNISISATEATLSNVTVWSANSILTQGRGDSRYIAESFITNFPVSYGNDIFYGHYQTKGPSVGFPFVAGSLLTGSYGIVGVANATDPCNIEFWPGEGFNLMRFRSYNRSIVFNVDGLAIETGTSGWFWTANTVLTQGRGDARYQPIGSYLTTANAATTYLPSANFTYANIGGTIPTATNSTLGAIKVGSNLTIANGVLSATSSGGFQNGDTLNGGTY